jgi:acetyltransferase-like isoleucine patch superfamily enzyme
MKKNRLRNSKNIFKSIHSVFTILNERFGSGFLGSLPTDIWSSSYTKWLKLSGAKIGSGSAVHRRVSVRHPENIIIGENVLIPASTDMAGMGKIEIGNNTLVGASVRFITNHHPLDDATLTRQEQLMGTQKSVKVGNNCWIMNNVLIIAGEKGIKIGNNVWVASGSVVASDVEDNVLIGGIPAKVIRER